MLSWEHNESGQEQKYTPLQQWRATAGSLLGHVEKKKRQHMYCVCLCVQLHQILGHRLILGLLYRNS